MIRTTIIAGGLLGLGIFTAAPAMAAPLDCPKTGTCPLLTYYLGTGPSTAAGQFTTAWTTAPGTVATAWATAPQTVLKVYTDALGITNKGTTGTTKHAGTAH